MIFFTFFSLLSAVGENISAEIMSVATEENESIFHREINQPRGIQFPQIKGRSFQENWFHLHNWLHYDKEKDAAFCHVCMQAIDVRYWLLLGKMMPSSQKGFKAGRRLYI